MVPGHFETVEALPRLTSGKVDRKALKVAPLTIADADGEQEEPPENQTEAALLAAAKQVFGNQPIAVRRATSSPISAAIRCSPPASSAVRETPGLAGITLQDVYRERTLRAISDALIARTGGAGTRRASATSPSSRRPCCAARSAGSHRPSLCPSSSHSRPRSGSASSSPICC